MREAISMQKNSIGILPANLPSLAPPHIARRGSMQQQVTASSNKDILVDA
jgi:hypothetical protein